MMATTFFSEFVVSARAWIRHTKQRQLFTTDEKGIDYRCEATQPNGEVREESKTVIP
ncbi:hypothetical protein SAMN04487950_3865 [Halogranum rubrum]|uniref:Uncharacterized protein n=1 Tax=Halogranum rubrum TaxID=553466 RepID=A0A1I4HWZ8_9EURY|nr:hypothetical protein SAMN04487950_3865 [Halogranum rubrum]